MTISSFNYLDHKAWKFEIRLLPFRLGQKLVNFKKLLISNNFFTNLAS